MSQNRLSGLAILSIENTRSRELNTKDIMNEFAERKARRMQIKLVSFLGFFFTFWAAVPRLFVYACSSLLLTLAELSLF